MITPEKILENRDWIHDCIEQYISSPRKEKLLEFYNKFDDRLSMMPASHKSVYHSAFPGGYFDHVRRVIEAAIDLNKVWEKYGVNTSTYTTEELIFSALNHDLGKMGDEENESYIPQTDNWRKEKLGEDYAFNTKLQFATVPDRGLFLLQSNGISYTFNEMVAIRIHDALYDEANKSYLLSYSSETKPRTALPFIVHQADLLAARIEWEIECLDKANGGKTESVKKTEKKIPTKTKALSSVGSPKLKNAMNSFFAK